MGARGQQLGLVAGWLRCLVLLLLLVRRRFGCRLGTCHVAMRKKEALLLLFKKEKPN